MLPAVGCLHKNFFCCISFAGVIENYKFIWSWVGLDNCRFGERYQFFLSFRILFPHFYNVNKHLCMYKYFIFKTRNVLLVFIWNQSFCACVFRYYSAACLLQKNLMQMENSHIKALTWLSISAFDGWRPVNHGVKWEVPMTWTWLPFLSTGFLFFFGNL